MLGFSAAAAFNRMLDDSSLTKRDKTAGGVLVFEATAFLTTSSSSLERRVNTSADVPGFLATADLTSSSSSLAKRVDISELTNLLAPPVKTLFVIEFNSRNELITAKLYKDNNIVVSTELTTGPIIWWVYECEDTKVWKIELYHKDELVTKVERTTEEIFWNNWSFLEIKN